jgi:hypothetical protein
MSRLVRCLRPNEKGPRGGGLTDESDPVAPINLERDVVEERPAGERF